MLKILSLSSTTVQYWAAMVSARCKSLAFSRKSRELLVSLCAAIFNLDYESQLELESLMRIVQNSRKLENRKHTSPTPPGMPVQFIETTVKKQRGNRGYVGEGALYIVELKTLRVHFASSELIVLVMWRLLISIELLRYIRLIDASP